VEGGGALRENDDTPGGRRGCSQWNSASASAQKEVTEMTLTLGTTLSKSADYLTTAPADDGSGTLSALLVCMILVMVVIAKLFGGMVAPFKEVIKAVFAALGALVLTGALVVMLVAALVMTA
jgi:hypothetical protein